MAREWCGSQRDDHRKIKKNVGLGVSTSPDRVSLEVHVYGIAAARPVCVAVPVLIIKHGMSQPYGMLLVSSNVERVAPVSWVRSSPFGPDLDSVDLDGVAVILAGDGRHLGAAGGNRSRHRRTGPGAGAGSKAGPCASALRSAGLRSTCLGSTGLGPAGRSRGRGAGLPPLPPSEPDVNLIAIYYDYILCSVELRKKVVIVSLDGDRPEVIVPIIIHQLILKGDLQ